MNDIELYIHCECSTAFYDRFITTVQNVPHWSKIFLLCIVVMFTCVYRFVWEVIQWRVDTIMIPKQRKTLPFIIINTKTVFPLRLILFSFIEKQLSKMDGFIQEISYSTSHAMFVLFFYWLTKDIGQQEANGKITIIGRVKHIFKLQNGTYVA